LDAWFINAQFAVVFNAKARNSREERESKERESEERERQPIGVLSSNGGAAF
jgi:hypothetical protein